MYNRKVVEVEARTAIFSARIADTGQLGINCAHAYCVEVAIPHHTATLRCLCVEGTDGAYAGFSAALDKASIL